MKDCPDGLLTEQVCICTINILITLTFSFSFFIYQNCLQRKRLIWRVVFKWIWMYYSIERIYINHMLRDNNRGGKGWSPQSIASEKLEICTKLAWFQGFIKIYKQFFPQGDPSKFASLVFRVFDENAVSFLSRVHTSWLSPNSHASKICVRHVDVCVQRAIITRCAFDHTSCWNYFSTRYCRCPL